LAVIADNVQMFYLIWYSFSVYVFVLYLHFWLFGRQRWWTVSLSVRLPIYMQLINMVVISWLHLTCWTHWA